MQRVWVWLWVSITMAFDRSTWWFAENIHPQEAKAVKELAKDDDIVILPADKGRATVVMDRKDYSAKMRACKCQLFTDEGSRRLPKRLNYCFNVLASATNRSI